MPSQEQPNSPPVKPVSFQRRLESSGGDEETERTDSSMHHTLRFYGKYRKWFLRYYIFQAKWTRLPVVGRAIRGAANLYGQKGSSAYLLTPEEANAIIDSAGGLALGPCTCREVFHNCHNRLDAEIMVGLGKDVFPHQRPHDYRELGKDEAKQILEECHKKGLIHTLIKCRGDFYALCNCCSCCCVPLRLKKKYGIGKALKRDEGIVEIFRRDIINE